MSWRVGHAICIEPRFTGARVRVLRREARQAKRALPPICVNDATPPPSMTFRQVFAVRVIYQVGIASARARRVSAVRAKRWRKESVVLFRHEFENRR